MQDSHPALSRCAAARHSWLRCAATCGVTLTLACGTLLSVPALALAAEEAKSANSLEPTTAVEPSAVMPLEPVGEDDELGMPSIPIVGDNAGLPPLLGLPGMGGGGVPPLASGNPENGAGDDAGNSNSNGDAGNNGESGAGSGDLSTPNNPGSSGDNTVGDVGDNSNGSNGVGSGTGEDNNNSNGVGAGDGENNSNGSNEVGSGNDSNNNSNDESDSLVVLRSIELSSVPSRAVPVGATAEDLNDLLGAVIAAETTNISNAAYDETYLIELTWDFSTFDSSKPGLVVLTATPVLPEGFCWAAGMNPVVSCLISVQEANSPLLNAGYLQADGVLMFPWVTPDAFAVNDITAWISLDGGAWQPFSSYGWVQSDGLFLFTSLVQDTSSYQLRIDYPEMKYSVVTVDSQQHLIIDYVTGDRDGGDGEGNGAADNEQEAPGGNDGLIYPVPPSNQLEPGDLDSSDETNGSENGSETVAPLDPSDTYAPSFGASSSTAYAVTAGTTRLPSAAQATSATGQTLERYNATQTTVSGTRLNDLARADDTVTFDQNGVVVSFASSFITSLHLTARDTFSVYALQDDANTVRVAVTVSNTALSDTPSMAVRVPYVPQNKDATFSVVNADEPDTSSVSAWFDGSALHFSSNRTGTFHIVENDAMPLAEADTAAVDTNIAYGATRTIAPEATSAASWMSNPTLSLAALFAGFAVVAALIGCGVLAYQRRREQ